MELSHTLLFIQYFKTCFPGGNIDIPSIIIIMNNYALIWPWDVYAESIHQDNIDIFPDFWNHIPGRFYLVTRFWIRLLYGVVYTEYEGWSQRTLMDNQPLSLVTLIIELSSNDRPNIFSELIILIFFVSDRSDWIKLCEWNRVEPHGQQAHPLMQRVNRNKVVQSALVNSW